MDGMRGEGGRRTVEGFPGGVDGGGGVAHVDGWIGAVGGVENVSYVFEVGGYGGWGVLVV